MPGLDRHAGKRTAPHAGFDEFAPAAEGFALSLEGGADFFPFGYDEGIIDVGVGLDLGEDFNGLVCAAGFCEPAQGVGEEGDSEQEDYGGDELDGLYCAEGGGAWDEGAGVADEEYDEDALFDG